MQNIKEPNKQLPHILIVDDDERILKLLKKFLLQNNFLVSTSASPKESLEMLKNFQFDLVVLDVMMPEITGIEFAKQVREAGSSMPVIMLTALSEPEDRIKGLEAGANDYMSKPFEPRELLLRINNLVNTQQAIKNTKQVVRFGNCKYDLNSKNLTKNNEEIKLNSSDHNLLEILIDNIGEPISREILGNLLGGVNPRSVDVQVVRLRMKIETDSKNPLFLKTVRNKGYVLYAN